MGLPVAIAAPAVFGLSLLVLLLLKLGSSMPRTPLQHRHHMRPTTV